MSVADKKEITNAKAKALLEVKAEELDALQRRVLDYTIKFSYLDSMVAEQMVEELIEKGELDRLLAVQITNCMPESIPELRTFLGRQRIISEETLNNILNIIKKYKSTG